MPKYKVEITANDGDSAESVMKTVHTAVETNPSLNLESVNVSPVPEPPDNNAAQQTERVWRAVNE